MSEGAATINPYRPHLLRIESKREETPDVRTLTLGFVDEVQGADFPAWQPGQFGEYTVFGAGESVFALANTPDRDPANATVIECTYRVIGKAG